MQTDNVIRLTALASCAGCAAKLAPGVIIGEVVAGNGRLEVG